MVTVIFIIRPNITKGQYPYWESDELALWVPVAAWSSRSKGEWCIWGDG